MALKRSQPQEVDLERTDRLPILEGAQFDAEFEDDSIRMDHPAAVAEASPALNGDAAGEFVRPSPVDLPSLAESVRSVEVRIERQTAEYESLRRSYERVQEAEAAATARATVLEKDLAEVQGVLEAQLARSREIEKTLADKAASIDATALQVHKSLDERDAQLAALQAEHATLLATQDAREENAAQLAADLAAARAQTLAVSIELQGGQQSSAALSAQLKRDEAQLNAARADLTASKQQNSSYLERLRTRVWRIGFEQNLFRELDAKAGAADSLQDALRSERDLLRTQFADLETTLAAQNAVIEKMQSAAAAHTAAFEHQGKELGKVERARAEWVATLNSAETQLAQLRADLAERDAALANSQASAAAEARRMAQLQSEAENREEEMTVLMAHLQEARRPIQVIEADMQRLKEEVASKSGAIQELTEEGERLRATLERTRGALEEREFLIRRLERSESNNATALGRIQTSMERLGSAPLSAPVAPDWSAEFIRIDGDTQISHALGRRTRIGRAAGCELQIDSTSVSRHHALILMGPIEAIIEDLNSTNGVILNGRKVTRQALHDGDIVVIGETQFRYAVNPAAQTP
jgi:chromosome segregation ATPase